MKQLDPKRLPRRCPCGKIRCRDIQHARQVHAIIWATKGGDALVRIYECEYHGWHWTRELHPQQKAAA